MGMQNALEEGRALLETADRQRRTAEQELADTNETLADLTNANQSIAAAKRKLDNEWGQLNADLDEMAAEANALKGGRKAMIKMETRIGELESELDAEGRRFADVSKNLRKSERGIKELIFSADEDKKN